MATETPYPVGSRVQVLLCLFPRPAIRGEWKPAIVMRCDGDRRELKWDDGEVGDYRISELAPAEL